MKGLNGFTPTERKIIEFLADGEVHSPEEVHAACLDPLSDPSMAGQHIKHIRAKLRIKDSKVAILTVWANRRGHYRMVQLLPKVEPA